MVNPDWYDPDYLAGRLSRAKATADDDKERSLVDAAHIATKRYGKPGKQGAKSDEQWAEERSRQRRVVFEAVDALLAYREQRHREWWLAQQSAADET